MAVVMSTQSTGSGWIRWRRQRPAAFARWAWTSSLIAACTGASAPNPVGSAGETALLGGQSGGETRPGMTQAVDCACLWEFVQEDTTPVALRARILRIQGACVELEVIEPLAETASVSRGEVVGGQWQELCSSPGGPEWTNGEEVLAVYEPGNQASDGCAEYRSCSQQRCGVDANAEGQDACDSSCVVDTRAACAAHAPEARLGGVVRLAQLAAGEVEYFLHGQRQVATLEQLSAPSCRDDQAELARRIPMPMRSAVQASALSDSDAMASTCPLPQP